MAELSEDPKNKKLILAKKDKKTLEEDFVIRDDLCEEERLRHYILSQVGSDTLLFDFRADDIFFAYGKFKELGLSLNKLFTFQKQIPIVYPWNTEYHSLRFGVNRRFNFFPLMIVMARHEKDVIRAFSIAKKYNIPVVSRGGSHSFAGFSLCDGMIIDQSRRTAIKIYKSINHGVLRTPKTCSSVIVEPGVLLGPLAVELSKYDLVLPIGTCPNNCITGFALGGGTGYLTRKYGITSDSLLEVKILLASGEVVICNEKQNEDLFWASRGGGGGNFGIVLSLTFRVYRFRREVSLLNLTYSFDKLIPLFKAYQNMVPNHPDELSINIRCSNGSGNIFLTAQFFGKKYVSNSEQFFGKKCVSNSEQFIGRDKNQFSELMKIFTNDLQPIQNKLEIFTYLDAVREIAGSGRWLPFFQTKNNFINKPFSDESLEIISKWLSVGNGKDIFLLEGMGGQMNRIDSSATAFPHRDGIFTWMLINAHWADQEEALIHKNWIRDFYAELEPSLAESCRAMVYVNGVDRDLVDWEQKYYGENLPRLKAIKKKYDAGNVFSFPQSIPLE